MHVSDLTVGDEERRIVFNDLINRSPSRGEPFWVGFVVRVKEPHTRMPHPQIKPIRPLIEQTLYRCWQTVEETPFILHQQTMLIAQLNVALGRIAQVET